MEFLAALERAIGAGLVQTGEAIAARHHTDWSGAPPVVPLALVRPRSTEEVAAVLRVCGDHRVAVVPQGGLTGLAGAAVPRADAIALSLDRMNAIESVDLAAATITVQAGATLQAVQEAAAAHGLQFGVDLGARGSCQIGGNLSTNAGGNGVLQFGMMREQTLGLEVVLADGSVLPMLRPMLKNNTGYDLKQFFIGAEGTLGVITRAVLRLHPAPRARATALVALADFDASLALLGRLQSRFPGAVAAFELMWRDFIETSLVWQGLREPFDAPHPFAALVELTGSDEAALGEALEALLAEAMEAGQAVDAAIAQSRAQALAFWKIREATAELPVHMQPPINFDVSLPMAGIGRFAAACRSAFDARWPGHHSIFFGHVGDSNLHITTDGRSIGGDEAGIERVVYDQVAAFGGSVSAEHGIGLHKKPYLHASRTPAEMAAMRAIKRALDPLDLLNPGKVFDQ
ncbi:FAD-binding oxidoreductase [Variovorax ginsengisoli]|uniref:FAD-binding oxidoreductase n=1 Tax=Variovorax ginsengisoli TaxID=363844 RepID=A0ABT8S012_9BURK|nr:FAD-binding oxidoreductase [Variovorax ginsengisoli]MDN8612374.1 FAD-binding oxidoreductase [Variovorax ginsengisoli]MDO1531544.1 FAD-binding oxidoreductase [Variovorax ginsengisoli]